MSVERWAGVLEVKRERGAGGFNFDRFVGYVLLLVFVGVGLGASAGVANQGKYSRKKRSTYLFPDLFSSLYKKRFY